MSGRIVLGIDGIHTQPPLYSKVFRVLQWVESGFLHVNPVNYLSAS